MKRFAYVALTVACLSSVSFGADSLHFGRFGKVFIYCESATPSSVARNWQSQFLAAYTELAGSTSGDQGTAPPPSAEEIRHLPLIEVAAHEPSTRTLGVVLSGDGGWSGFTQGLARTFADSGVAVVGWNSLQYFWRARTPDEASSDLETILRYYLSAWDKESVIVAGYSFGADVLPFLVNRLPADLLQRVQAIALIGPSHKAEFEFHVSDWLGSSGGKSALPVLPEVKKLKGQKVLAFYGEDEGETLCTDLTPDLAEVFPLKGGHHFGGDYAGIVNTILSKSR
jgi:type IV secretory pathway VirJ component